ncbi:DUF4912 domain-containing protein [Archangium violaceum]|uniref:DUF4912 domain-containing protein n=1 Tax=Archangium violaceum TaxID=83451 RepID=UPI00194F8094|nr:DUF4912 domain-containing protein [Archangium violaceum]QRN93910.1 DUF4912 domain-containing protein [Archangium violaceum]
MADLKSVTVEYLRELARKHLGRGHSKLKTKKDLLDALARLVPGLAKLAGEEEPGTAKADGTAGQSVRASVRKQVQEKVERAREKVKETRERVKGARKVPGAVSAASRTGTPEERPAQPIAPERALPGDDDEKTPVHPTPRPAEVVNFPPKPKPAGGRSSIDDEPTLTKPPAPESPPPALVDPPVHSEPPAHAEQHVHVAQHAAEPLVEGFFVARIAGEQEAFRHHLTESQRRRPVEALGSPDYDERLGELPMDYEDDTALLMPRDPHTLFVCWDFSAEARRRALDGLVSPRAVLRVYDDSDVLVRVIDVALESRSYYIHGLPPGRPYRVEAHFVGVSGRSRRIGHSSNRIFLPPAGPSEDTSVRLLRMPPVVAPKTSVEAVAATAPTRTADVEEREYITWRRVALPGSGGFEDIPERHRERVGPGGPGAPGEGAPEQEYLSVSRRHEGSSEQWAGLRDMVGSSEQRAWSYGVGASSEQRTWSQGPGGSSDQRVWSHGPGGSSDQRTWSQGGAGGSSEQWVWAYGPAGAVSESWTWSRPSSSGQGR